MTYDHAAGNLAAVRQLNEETMHRLRNLPALTEDQVKWIEEVLQTQECASERQSRVSAHRTTGR